MQPKTLVLGLVLLAGCDTPGPEPDACGASGYAGLVGQSLAAVTLPADLNARVIEPGMAVTLDFVADRLNVRLDEAGVITGVDCG